MATHMLNKVLIITEKYLEGGAEVGVSMSQSFLVGALRSTGLISLIQEFHCREFCLQSGREAMCRRLVEECAEFRPDMVIYEPLPEGISPTPETIQKIYQELGIKIFMKFGDTVNYTGEKELQSWLPYINHFAILDSLSMAKKYSSHPKFIRYIGTTVNPMDFHDKGLVRDIDVSFSGNLGIHPSRRMYSNFLRKNGVKIHVKEQMRIPVEEFSNILNRSKISLNFSATCIGANQLKARVYEAMACNSLLLEDYGLETGSFFILNKDFVVYRTKEELLEKVVYYLNHEEERQKIARSGHEKVTCLYNAKNMWGYALEQMGFSIPQELRCDPFYMQQKDTINSLFTSPKPLVRPTLYPILTLRGFVTQRVKGALLKLSMVRSIRRHFMNGAAPAHPKVAERDTGTHKGG